MSSPFDKRYGSDTMRGVFSDDVKFQVWRLLWSRLARAEKELGLDITDEQVKSLEDNIFNIDYELAEKYEQETHHDVMAHILAYGDQCPDARGIIHLGATSCFVTDNTEVSQQQAALILVWDKLLSIVMELKHFARRYKDLPTVGYTHLQVAQPTTVGKRACMWLQDLVMDLEEVDRQIQDLKLLGCKGATGTAASFLQLFNGDAGKVQELEHKIFENYNIFPISGQTYTRKQDFNVMQALAGIAQSASKIANDIRFLSHLGEINESFSKEQVGSSAMPYKKNPLNCERINSLSRLVICNLQNFAVTSSTQWLERTLDDSANRRVTIPETFLAVDEILITLQRVISRLQVNEDIIRWHYGKQLPYLLVEPLLMYLTKRGEDRQDTHERLRKLAHSSEPGHFLHTVEKVYNIEPKEITPLVDGLTGMATQQVEDYLDAIEVEIS